MAEPEGISNSNATTEAATTTNDNGDNATSSAAAAPPADLNDQQPPPQQRADPSSSSATTNIQRARYPLTSGLVSILERATSLQASSPAAEVERGLQQIIENSMTSLDSWFFTSSPEIRKALGPHRTCLRFSCKDGRLTITDLGVGMTRADLINLLGVGKYHIPKNKKKHKNGSQKKVAADQDEEEDVTTETSDDSDADDGGSDDDDE